MDDIRIGAAIRIARIRRRLRQSDLALAANVSRTTISRVERGALGALRVEDLRRIAARVEVDLELRARSRGSDVDRMLNAGHAALAERVIALITDVGGWLIRPELSFSVFGERGVIDIVAWNGAHRALLVAEIKTAIVDVGELIGTLDRKIRLGPQAVRALGWQPAAVGACLIVAESMTNRRRIAAHAATFRATLPGGIVVCRRWLRNPAGAPPRAVIFVSDDRARNARTGYAAVQRVRHHPIARSQFVADHKASVRGSEPVKRGANGPHEID
jgi:transcriptional regulator with XRE-family HTH domain